MSGFDPELWGEVAGGIHHGTIRGVSRSVLIREAGFAKSGGRALPPRPLVTSKSNDLEVLKLRKEIKDLKKFKKNSLKIEKKNRRIFLNLEKWSQGDSAPEGLKEAFRLTDSTDDDVAGTEDDDEVDEEDDYENGNHHEASAGGTSSSLSPR